MQPQAQQTSSFNGPAVAESIVGAVIRGGALSLEVLLHRNLGRRCFGINIFGAILLMAGFKVFCPHDDLRPLVWFAGLFLSNCLACGIEIFIRSWRGLAPMHTRYTGTPYLMRVFSRWNEVTIKQLESLAIFGVGVGVTHLNRPLGFYLMAAAGCMWFCMRGVALAERERALDMNDAVIEQTVTAERLHEMQGR